MLSMLGFFQSSLGFPRVNKMGVGIQASQTHHLPSQTRQNLSFPTIEQKSLGLHSDWISLGHHPISLAERIQLV